MYQNNISSLIPTWLIHSPTYSVVVVDFEGRYSFVNEVFKTKFAFLNTDFIGNPVDMAIHAEDIGKCSIAFCQCLENPTEIVQVQIRKPGNTQGDFYWTNWEFSLFVNADKQPIGVLCIGHDTTEMEHANKQTKEFAQKVETIIEEITDGFYILDRDWKFIKANKVAIEILGIPKDKLLGKVLWDIFPDTLDHNYPKEFHRAMNDYVTVSFDDYHSKRWFSTIAYPSPEGLTVFFKDVTEIHIQQEDLRYSQSKLQAILDSTTDGNILISPDYKILGFNAKANEVSKMFLKKELCEFADMWAYVMPNDEEDFYTDTQKAFAGEFLSFEREMHFAGISLWFMVSYHPVYDKAGTMMGVTFNTTNIDKRKRYALKLEEQNETLRDIAWQQSHEVRRPVANILGLINLLEEDIKKENHDIYLAYLKQSTQELDNIIHKIVEAANSSEQLEQA